MAPTDSPALSSRATSGPPSFFGLGRLGLIELMRQAGEPEYRADQLLTWVYQRHQLEPREMSNLPSDLRARLGEWVDLGLPVVESLLGNASGDTHKFVLKLRDGELVECVSMRTERRLTMCLSSQVGCALKCSFCATGLMGLRRNLDAGEIVAQVMAMGEHNGWQDERFNLVFMGMGEPLVNYEPVVQSIRVLREARGLNVGARRITVSTSGVVPQMRRLAGEGMALGLALSLHATTDAVRNELIPINRKWPIAMVLETAREYGRKTGRRVTLEYTLIDGVNDSPEDAERLCAFARGLPSKINLIPYNPVPGLPWKRPSPESVTAFAESLYPRAPAVTVRNTMGGEIWAACGQLGGLSPATG
jgi:23S rRNA (adenine2503-C2)-methyltransferase